MKLLEDRIREDGIVLPGDILKVDSFINHQIDPGLFMALAEEFKRLFAIDHVDKILTMEVSGIAPAFACGILFGAKVLFAKKTMSKTLGDDVYCTQVYSYTKGKNYDVMVSKKLLKPGESVLIIDDFLANGKALLGLIDLCEQARVEIKGIGVLIEKAFQGGAEEVLKKGYQVQSLARIQSFEENRVVFVGENDIA